MSNESINKNKGKQIEPSTQGGGGVYSPSPGCFGVLDAPSRSSSAGLVGGGVWTRSSYVALAVVMVCFPARQDTFGMEARLVAMLLVLPVSSNRRPSSESRSVPPPASRGQGRCQCRSGRYSPFAVDQPSKSRAKSEEKSVRVCLRVSRNRTAGKIRTGFLMDTRAGRVSDQGVSPLSAYLA